MANWNERLQGNLTRLSKQIKQKQWQRGSIVYYAGKHKDGLSPYSIEEGTSGSKSALIFLSREWAKLGYKVTVYSSCGDREGTYDGVEYINYYHFNPYDTFDVLIIFQHPKIMPLPIKARKVLFEWQDIFVDDEVYPRAQLDRFDKIFAKSKYQRDLMPFFNDDKFVIVTNGINKSIAALKDNEKNPYKLVYASRYYRGLESMLTYGWPIVKKEIPQAELHIFYGWTRRELDPNLTEWRAKMTELMQQDGIINRGMISQDLLIEEKSTASIHYYACTYPEIDCISVRESAMVGCVPVTTDFAVMSEKDYCVKISGEPEARETQEAVANKVVELLKNRQQLAEIREKFITAVQHETWDSIAKVWAQHFEN
jgi:glycosyltransferase involved in cell wall biosynthesis